LSAGGKVRNNSNFRVSLSGQPPVSPPPQPQDANQTSICPPTVTQFDLRDPISSRSCVRSGNYKRT